MKKKVKKKEKIEYEEGQPYSKYKRKKGWGNTLRSLVPSFFALAIASMALNITAQSLKSSGILEDDSHSRVGKLNSVTVSGPN
jgi:hypothetical protein